MDTEMNNFDERSQYACRGIVHVVKQGDTLYNIAKLYKIKVYDIMKSNPYVNIYNLQVGDELCIPVSNNNPIAFRPYVVKSDDTIMSILEKTNETFENLAKYNRIFNDLKLDAGTVILVPSKIEPRTEEVEIREE